MPSVIELFANPPSTPATVSSGGTTAPASGTSQSFTMAGGYASYPAASNAASPPTQFHIYDVALPSEIMLVTNVSGSTWTVTRGVDGTTPVAHTSGFTIAQVVSAGVLDDFTQNTTSIPVFQADATSHAVTTASTFTALTKAWAVPASDASVGTVYRLTAFGTGTMPATAGSHVFRVNAFGASIINSGGSPTGLVQFGATIFPVSTAFDWTAVVHVLVLTTGTSGTIFTTADVTISAQGVNLLATNDSTQTTVAGNGTNTSTAANTTASGNTIGLQFEWATNAGTMTCYGSIFERIGT